MKPTNPFHPDGNPLEELRDIIGIAAGDLPDIPAPTHWPALPADDTADAWRDLRRWVEALQERFGLDHHVLPGCWWRHNRHVEALAALRDHERASYSPTAPATAPVEWIRALRDITTVLAGWTSDTGCATGHHPEPGYLRAGSDTDFAAHVEADVRRRRDAEDDTSR